MAIQYTLLQRIQDGSVKQALTKALSDDGRLSFEEVKAIVESTYDYKGTTLREFNDLQGILKNARTLDERSKRYLGSFLGNYYHTYLQHQALKKTFTLPYSSDHIPKTTPKSRRPGLAMTAQYLTIHSTANPKSTAKNERSWLTNPSNTRTASYHLVVDETEAIECLPLNEVAWHAGDGGEGSGNRKSIGLEICESGDRKKTLDNAISLSAKILRDRGWDTSKLKRHHDWSKKNCPRILIDNAHRDKVTQTWDWFNKEVASLL